MSYAESIESSLDENCPALIEVAGPEIYRQNAFRVAGLSVEATPRDVSRHAEKLRMMQKFNANGSSKSPLALNPQPEDHTIRDAVHKLHDPERRLIDELFWFWPQQLGQGKSDEAVSLLAKNDIKAAEAYWLKLERSSESLVSMHNLAILYHCLALDLEYEALQRQLGAEEFDSLHKYWTKAFKRWKIVLGHEPFWSRLSARIRALEDPRLTTGLSRRIRASLPFALLLINAALAVRFAESGDMEAGKRQIAIMGLWEASENS
jgi:hypothetical protein